MNSIRFLKNPNKQTSMTEQKESRFKRLKVPLKFNLAFATGEITDAVAYQGFSFLIFTFYYAVIGIDV